MFEVKMKIKCLVGILGFEKKPYFSKCTEKKRTTVKRKTQLNHDLVLLYLKKREENWGGKGRWGGRGDILAESQTEIV